jgi:hypothetical protein
MWHLTQFWPDDLAKEIYWSGLHFVKRKKYDVEREKPQEDPRKIVNRPILKTTNDPQSRYVSPRSPCWIVDTLLVIRWHRIYSQRVMEEPSGVVPRDDPFDTWTRWQRKEMSSVWEEISEANIQRTRLCSNSSVHRHHVQPIIYVC